MIIAKKVYQTLTAEQSKTGIETEVSFDMFYRVGAGWIATKDAASVFNCDKHVTKWLDVAFNGIKENELLNVID